MCHLRLTSDVLTPQQLARWYIYFASQSEDYLNVPTNQNASMDSALNYYLPIL